MRPDERDFDDEIRGHLAIGIRERVERGEDPATARRHALAELGYLPDLRDSLHRVWRGRAFDAVQALWQDVRIGLRSLRRSPGLAFTVVLTLALGIGANAAIVSVIRGVLLAPLGNRGEDRIVSIRQSAPGIGTENLTFSVPEVRDITAGVRSIRAFGEFSTVEFTLLGLGEPRVVRAGVVNGAYFDVMGLRPALGRLLEARDDGPEVAGAAVLSYRLWHAAFAADPAVVGRRVRLGARTATIVGVLEPSTPYPADTEIVANIVTSPHHLSALMTTERTHRMTELFGRLDAEATLEDARAELTRVHAAMMQGHPQAYPSAARIRLDATKLRDQVTAPARPVLLLLLAAAALVFLVACANVINLMLARTARREGELAIRAALGAGRGALRRTLLAESLVLCGLGAAAGVVLAFPLVPLFARFAARYSARALEVTVDGSLLWIGAALAIAAAVLLAYLPRLPVFHAGRSREPAPHRRLRTFAIAQIALSFVLLAGAGTLVGALRAMERAQAGFDVERVLGVEVPTSATGVGGADVVAFIDEARRRIARLPEVRGVAAGSFMPWSDPGEGFRFPFAVEGFEPDAGGETPYGRFRIVTPGFFGVLGVPLVAGRDFTEEDRSGTEPVVIVSESLARSLFTDGDALHRTLWWTDPLLGDRIPRRIVGVAADMDDERLVPAVALTVYHPVRQMGYASRIFVRASGGPEALAPAVMRVIRDISAEQAVERAAPLEEVRAQVLAPVHVNAAVFSAFAVVALVIAGVGIAGMLSYSVKARSREFGVHLAMGATRPHLLRRVLSEGAAIAATGLAAGAAGGIALAGMAGRLVEEAAQPRVPPLLAAAAVLLAAALIAALMPAARAARVDVMEALRPE